MDLAEKEFRVVWKHLVTDGNLPVERKSERELWIKFKNGSFIECRTEENPDQLIGEGLDFVILAEAARLKKNTWDQYIRPALADKQGKALFTSTPRGFNYFWEFYNRGQDETQPDWQSWMIPSRLNPILPQSEIEEARRNSSPAAFAQEWEAKFIAYAGLVFPEFDENIHVRALNFNSNLRTSIWVDPGTSAPYAALLVQTTPDEYVYVLDEIYRTGRVSDQVIAEVRQKWGHMVLDDFDMPKQEIDVIIDKAAAEAAATWRAHGWRAWGEKPKIAQGIEVHHRFLSDPFKSRPPQTNGDNDPGHIEPRIWFDPKCRMTIKEHGSYHYPDENRKRVETNPSMVPVDIDNHTIDALRYGYYNTWPQLFNVRLESETLEAHSYDELGIDTRSGVIEDSYSFMESEFDRLYPALRSRDFSLGNY